MSEHTYVPLDEKLVDGDHIRRLGMSVWLLLFLVKKQTGREGWINYGRPVSYRWIFDQIPRSMPERTIRLWMQTLRVNGYIVVERLPFGQGMKIRIVNSKKWPKTQLTLPLFPGEEDLSKNCDSTEEKLFKPDASMWQDLAAPCGKKVTSISLYKENFKEKRKSDEDLAQSVPQSVQNGLGEMLFGKSSS
jgi:hypothetical protein